MSPPLLSIVMPVLDEARALPAALDALARVGGFGEVVVVDGGSRDGSAAIARGHPLAPRVIEAPRGRARQMNTGAAAAHGEVLLFLHADTRLPRDAVAQVTGALRRFHVIGGDFRLRFEGGDRFSRVLGRWRAAERRLGIYYGDSAIFVRRTVFERLGGYREQPIMEDYDLARRLERHGSTVCLPGPVVTSSRRWRRQGATRTLATWVAIRWLYLAGVPAERLAPLYRAVR